MDYGLSEHQQKHLDKVLKKITQEQYDTVADVCKQHPYGIIQTGLVKREVAYVSKLPPDVVSACMIAMLYRGLLAARGGGTYQWNTLNSD